ncbi:MAG: aldo/keto reductase [Hyphomicrobiaceae bacterium]|nr:aldo/keto reductase [Hyphomicrobiaceae bacterium]
MPSQSIKHAVLPSGELVPQLGQGTWQMAERRDRRGDEIAALRAGIDLGLTLIDTAEMYGEGAAEDLVAEAIAGRRDEVFLVSKVYPHNASSEGVIAACERSLKRLQTDRIDLYLLHWMGRHPLAETVAGFQALKHAGKIRHWGVSNLDTGDMRSLWNVPGGRDVATNQVLYNLKRRAADWDLLPWQRERSIPLMAYSPVEQARLISNTKLVRFARDHDATPAQVALAWLLANDDVIVIPKAGSVAHVQENAKARELRLSAAQLRELDALFPAPRSRRSLEML